MSARDDYPLARSANAWVAQHGRMCDEIDTLRARNAELEHALERVKAFVDTKAAEERWITRIAPERPAEGQIFPPGFSVRMEVPTNTFWANQGPVSAEVAAEVARIGQMRPERPNVPLRVVETTVSDPIEP